MPELNVIKPNGQPTFGYFPQTPSVINWDDFIYRTPMGGTQNRIRNYLDRKQFQYIGVVSDELLVGCALADFSFLGVAFVYTYEPATQNLEEFSIKVPLAQGFELTNRPLDGTSTVNAKGSKIRIDAQPEPRSVSLDIELSSGLKVDAKFSLARPFETQPMAVLTQTGKTGWTFTEKIAGVTAEGSVSGSFGTLDLATIGACAHYDYSIGYMRRETFWNWACFSGRADDHVVGLNLSCGVNETRFSENCIWIDGQMIPVGPTHFDYNRAAPAQDQWSVATADGQVELTFEPEGAHEEHLNVGLIASNFVQVFGKFSGVFRPQGGSPIEIKNLYGFCEDQYMKA